MLGKNKNSLSKETIIIKNYYAKAKLHSLERITINETLYHYGVLLDAVMYWEHLDRKELLHVRNLLLRLIHYYKMYASMNHEKMEDSTK